MFILILNRFSKKIANILQVLAMSDDDKDLKAQDLYSKFRNVRFVLVIFFNN